MKLESAYKEGLKMGRCLDPTLKETVVIEVDNKSVRAEVGKHLVLLDLHNQQMHCDCDDFKFTFYASVDKAGGSLAKLDLPKSKGVRPPRAHAKPGMCKHLIQVYEAVMEKQETILTLE